MRLGRLTHFEGGFLAPRIRPERTPRSWTKTWSLMTLGFAAIVFGALASDWDPAQVYAQEAPKTKTKVGKKAEPKNLPSADSLTNGKKIDAVVAAAGE